jgi:hypothetical protein
MSVNGENHSDTVKILLDGFTKIQHSIPEDRVTPSQSHARYRNRRALHRDKAIAVRKASAAISQDPGRRGGFRDKNISATCEAVPTTLPELSPLGARQGCEGNTEK